MQIELTEAEVLILEATVFRAEQDLANWSPQGEEEEEAKLLGERVWWAAEALVKGWRNGLIALALGHAGQEQTMSDDDAYAAFLRERDATVTDEELDDIADLLMDLNGCEGYFSPVTDRLEVMLDRVRAARKAGA